MKAIELAKKLLEYPDFDVNFSFSYKDDSKWGIVVRKYEITDQAIDIAHSDKIFSLGGEEI